MNSVQDLLCGLLSIIVCYHPVRLEEDWVSIEPLNTENTEIFKDFTPALVDELLNKSELDFEQDINIKIDEIKSSNNTLSDLLEKIRASILLCYQANSQNFDEFLPQDFDELSADLVELLTALQSAQDPVKTPQLEHSLFTRAVQKFLLNRMYIRTTTQLGELQLHANRLCLELQNQQLKHALDNLQASMFSDNESSHSTSSKENMHFNFRNTLIQNLNYFNLFKDSKARTGLPKTIEADLFETNESVASQVFI